MTMKYRTTTQTIEDGIDGVLSDASPDAYGDICECSNSSNWELARFRKNPLALLNHSGSFPIGVWKNVRVEANALRGTLHLAPKGTSERHDEVRALIDAKILVGLSVGFKPITSVPIPGKGYRYTKMELMECSVVSMPANENALMACRSLGISTETQRLLFKEMTIGARIRQARRSVRKAKQLQALADTPAKRQTMARTIAAFERQERELSNQLRTVPKPTAQERQLEHAKQVRARSIELLNRIDARIAEEVRASPRGQQRAHEQQVLENYEAQARRHQDPVQQKFDEQNQSWRGVKLPGLTWRGTKL